MQAIFLARGPSFNENIQIRSVNNVDIYHIACHILELIPNPYANAGSLENLTHIFRSKTDHSSKISNNNCSSLFIKFWSLPLLLFVFIFFEFF
jgi:ectonucleotide pyrophosphatase/phosphodiesterase family protein 5